MMRNVEHFQRNALPVGLRWEGSEGVQWRGFETF